MDASQRNRLLVISALVRRAEAALREGSDVGNGLAVSLYHDAVELTLWLVLANSADAPGKRDDFSVLLEGVAVIYQAAMGSALPFQRHLRSLNSARVAFKHHGQVPNRSTALEVTEFAREFVSTLARDLLRTSIERFHPVAAIRTVVIKERLEAALDSESREDVEGGMIGAADANWYLDGALREVFRQPAVHVPSQLTGVREVDSVLGALLRLHESEGAFQV
jgi:hypothetical protein